MPIETGPDAVSPELDSMVCDLLDDFLTALANGEDPGVLIRIEDARSNRYQAAFSEDGTQACIDGAESFIASNAAGLPVEHLGAIDRYVLAYAGAVEIDGAFEDAVIASFYQRGMATAYSAYLLYQGFGCGDAFMWSEPEPAGEEPPLI